VNVIDAFHNVHGQELPMRFVIDERRTSGGIRLTEEFFRLAESERFADLNAETESRWRLVETAWELRVPRQVVQVTCDESGEILHAATSERRRANVTTTRDALNGYQKGRCFYCYRDFSIDPLSKQLADVDHFFPRKLFYCSGGKPIDGLANLVLSCRDCNRGNAGKFDRLPKIDLLERLHKRNEYLIGSHHPLRETLMLQTGITEPDRRSFLQSAYDCAITHVIVKWAPSAVGSPMF
jgi:5-methylcytosine-specific restriction endonuclease McrA